MEIEKGIAIPESWRRKKLDELPPFEKMEVGDSVIIEKNGHSSWSFAFSMIQVAQHKHKIKLTTRLIDDERRRIWRTE